VAESITGDCVLAQWVRDLAQVGVRERGQARIACVLRESSTFTSTLTQRMLLKSDYQKSKESFEAIDNPFLL